jgi:Ni/Co efflux regulator RcnB
VRTPGGFTVDEGTARRAALAEPANTRRGRESRASQFVSWCTERGRVPTDPGTLADWANQLADAQHPTGTITSYITTVASVLALNGYPVRDDERDLIARVLASRSTEESTDPDNAGDALQATECTREDLAAMVATCDRSTARGLRDACALLLHWYMAGRVSEPVSLSVHDVTEVTADILDLATDEVVTRPALELVLRRSKTNPYGRLRDTVRLVAQDDPALCPVRAWRAWSALLAAHGTEHTGPLLRRIDRWDNIGGTGACAGRRPHDPRRADGITDRTLRNIIHDRAAAADLLRELRPEEREVLSTCAERAALAGAADDTERETIRTERRLRRRALRRKLKRYTGHSMRRGCVRHMERAGTPRHVIELHARFAPGSKALARYRVGSIPWEQNPTLSMGDPHAARRRYAYPGAAGS